MPPTPPITLSNTTVAANATAGTIIGTFNTSVRLQSQTDPGAYFLVSNTNLMVAWAGQAIPGMYQIQVHAPGGPPQSFNITITPATVAPPTPTGVSWTPPSATLPDNSGAGTIVAAFTIAMSDGSAFAGTVIATSTATKISTTGNQLVLARALTPADDGPQTWGIIANQNNVTITGTLPVDIVAAPPIPITIALNPATMSLPDNTASGTQVSSIVVGMSDGSTFSGRYSSTNPLFAIGPNNNVVLARALTPSDDGTQTTTIQATQNNTTISAGLTLSVTATTAGIGYSVVVTMFGTGATYNSDGTVTGTPNGPVYTYNPDTPDAHTTTKDLGDFISDFANFTQGCVHCTRDDTALRVFFRKDKSPDPTRIEIILELGHFTYDGSAANLPPFALQVLKAGIPQPITITTTSGTTTTTTANFPQLGWATRWRWNPTPRALVRKGSDLLPSGLNLVPNLNQALATSYNVADCGTPGFSSNQSSGGTNGVVTAYSSAFAPGHGTNKNPVGVNEGATIGCNMGGTGGRPELGVVTEWNANYIVDGNASALAATMVHGEVDGGLPLAIRDASTGWAPTNFFNTPNVAFFPGQTNRGSPNVDAPLVPEPSGLDGTWWFPDLNHMPLLSYVPYLLTGDPYFLENMQLMASFLVGANYYNRAAGFLVNGADPNTPTSTPFPQSFPSWRYATRGLAWALRTYVACYLATPTSVPSWLQPKLYYDKMLTANANYGNTWGPDYATDNPTLPQYPNQNALGFGLSSNYFDEIFFHAYLMMAGGFALNQGKRAEWLKYLTWAAISPLEYGNGTNGAPTNWPTPYIMPMMPVGTDYNGSPAAFARPADGIKWLADNAQNNQTYTKAQAWSWGSLDYLPLFPAWAPGIDYHCNSWMVEMRSGVPVLPNVGDVASITITSSFTGSPITISHTISSSDITTLAAAATDLLSFINLSAPGVNPIIDSLLTQINNNPALTAAGIIASYTLPNPGTAGVANHNFINDAAGRIWLTYNSDGSYVGGGPTVGDILITATLKTTTNNTMYVSPNGDGVSFGTHNAACFSRSVCYNAGKSGMSTTAPSGTTPQTLVGDLNWCYSPEFKSSPLIVPGGFSSTLPQIGYGGIYDSQPMAPSYVDWLRAGVAGLVTAGLAGAPGAYTTWKSIFDHYQSTGYFSQFNFSMVP